MFETVENAIKKGIENRVFTGASVGVWSGPEKVEFLKGYGTTESELKKYPVNNQTFYDLASLTKPFVTTLSVMKLVEEKRVKLTTTLDHFFPLKGDNKAKITIDDLLSHASGLSAHIKFYKECARDCNRFVIDKILSLSLEYETKKTFIYSDLGYILLGEIIKKITEREIEEYWYKKIASPLDLQNSFTFSNDQKLDNQNCSVTRNIENPKIVHCGEVHDDNCRILGGIAGHAGLFGNIEGVFALTREILKLARNEDNRIISERKNILKFFHKKRNSTWVCGFDTPSALYSSSGKYFSKNSIGHLGFTGTSFWIDLEKERIIVLLTNRAYYENSLKELKKFRPYFHDIIMKKLG